MGTAYIDWDASWTATTIAASTLTNAGTLTTAAISGDLKAETEISIEISYGATATEGVKVYVFKDANGTYEAVADKPWGITLPYTVSTTHRRVFNIGNISNCKIHLTNDSGADVTATVSSKQSVVTTV